MTSFPFLMKKCFLLDFFLYSIRSCGVFHQYMFGITCWYCDNYNKNKNITLEIVIFTKFSRFDLFICTEFIDIFSIKNMSLTTFDSLKSNLAQSLNGIERYNPNNIPKLERFVDVQVDENFPFSVDENLSLLKVINTTYYFVELREINYGFSNFSCINSTIRLTCNMLVLF